jgi:glucose-1-phosphatase
VKAILFDLGNVLVQYDHQQTLIAAATLGKVAAEDMDRLQRKHSQAAGVGEMDAEELHRLFNREFGLDSDFAHFVAAFSAGIQRDEAALAYALSLQNRPDVTVAVISNTNAVHVLWLDEFLPELREFDLVMMSNEVGLLKPDPAIFETALELLGVLPQQAIFVDDLAENVEAARALGMAGLVHTTWEETRPALEQWLANR